MYDRDNVPWKMCRQDKALAQSEERKPKQGHLRSVPLGVDKELRIRNQFER